MFSENAIIFYYRPANKYSLIALAGVIESNPSLNQTDLYFETSENHLLSRIETLQNTYHKIIIAVSLFSYQVPSTQKTLDKIKNQNYTNIYLITGGPHASGNPTGTLQMGFDAVVVGEGEEAFHNLITKLFNKEPLNNIAGVMIHHKDGHPVYHRPENYIDINRYMPLNKKYHKFGPIEITRGCPFSCTYCQTPRIFGHKVRHRSLKNILQCVEIMNSLKFRDIRFTTPNFFSWQSVNHKEPNIEALSSMFNEIRRIMPHGRMFIGSFPSEVRPENVTKDTIKLVKEFGSNDNLVIGAQSGSARILDLIHRNHSIEDVYTATELIISAGFRANVDIIFGIPGETEDDQLQTVALTEKLIKMGAYIHAHTFMHLIQTPLENAKPGEITDIYKKLLNRWVPKGKIYGQWEAQLKRL